ncbi:hypothetical protein PR202_gb22506 [Eleusine coracana subsp. coracana]|uniref:Flavonoid 3'-monooxygenase n=1 Tax=Eleusine coracana subsp. coracana TaxID=191504 RepID=A0AAV5FGU0_ELECO|nr:hypothetical protein PR202_gb22506 [Eleusine coracana subsp. coracana]
MRVHFGSFPVVVASSVDTAKLFLKTHDAAFVDRPKMAAGKYTTYKNYSNIGRCPYGAYWRQARKRCADELLSARRIDAFEHVRREEVSAHGAGQEVPVTTWKEFRWMLDELFLLNGVLNIGDWIPWLASLDLQGYVWRMKRVGKLFDRFMENVLELEQHDERRRHEGDVFVVRDMVDRLLQLADDPNLELWDAPEEFRPERSIGSKIDVKGQDFELLPFGSGRRMCPAYTLGLKVIHLSVANLLHGFAWRLPDGVTKEELNMEEIFSSAYYNILRKNP